MKIAFAYWDERIAPVFDTARHVRVLEVTSGRIVNEADETLPEDLIVQKALQLVQLGIDTLVCGAISRSLHAAVNAYGIRVIPFVAGNLRDVIQAWISGNLTLDAFSMPGCHGRGGRRFRGMHGAGHRVKTPRERGPKIEANKRNWERQNGQKARGLGVLSTFGGFGYCLCPLCGHREEHEFGVPCIERNCPKCGFAMTRQ